MANDLGDVLPLSITIRDTNGNLANAGNVALSIQLPDGTTFSQASVAPDSTGIYIYPFLCDQSGRHVIYWEATGSNASAYSDVFYVSPSDTGNFISLLQFKAHIKKPDGTDDEVIRTFISAACQMITDRVGQITVQSFVEDRVIIRGFVSLAHYPVTSLASVGYLPALSESPGYTLADPDTGLVNIDGYGDVRLTYTAGRNPIPQNYILAALELTQHLWKNSQQNAGGGRPPVGLDETVVPGVTFALPYNVRQLLGIDKMPRTQVWI